MQWLEVMDEKYYQFDNWYNNSPLYIKLLVLTICAVGLLIVFSNILPIAYRNGQEFGKMLYKYFGN